MQFRRLSDGTTILNHSGDLENSGAGSIDCIEIAQFGNGSGNGMIGGAGRPTGEREFFFDDPQISSPLLGDYNQNGLVDAADYTLWRDTLGQSVPNGTGADGNGDGVVNQADYDVWKAHFGTSGAIAVSAPAPVPEPNGVALFLTAELILFLRSKNWKSPWPLGKALL
jgi:hypothetical protein